MQHGEFCRTVTMDRRKFIQLAAAGTGLLAGAAVLGLPLHARAAEAYPLPPLPYAENALEPYISARTISFHYGKHTKAYYDKTNTLAAGMSGMALHEVFLKAAGKPDSAALFNNAAQAWNHTFYWNGMKPSGGGAPGKRMMEHLQASFGGYEQFREAFSAAAKGQFGSGWAWLVRNSDGTLEVVKTANAENPMVQGKTPVLVCDVWEHAYYLDYQNRRADYVSAFLDHLVDWDAAEKHLT